ncbi:transposon-transfer assisting family protein [[Clostridium] symbiosum]|uniref:transposon-transfer assisting family protein n=1 Tax=Clostridium symbiosum TaxID=1512 RepID=UPI00189FDC94|nr:transposon-transfer assisting family protein [[Clostridium] symbiosum]
MNRFTVEEINLISIYHTGTRNAVIEEMTAALPDMDSEFQELALHTMDKLNGLTDDEFLQLSIDPADEGDG